MANEPTPFTRDVLNDVVLERHRQIELWGHNTDAPDGTGPDVPWLSTPDRYLADRGAVDIELALRAAYDNHARSGEPLTFRHFLVEELAEALQETDPERLYTELIQVAAVATSWCEKLRTR